MGKSTARRGPGRARQTFRQWRRSRPFWGGLFFILSGLMLFFSSNLELNGLQVRVGVEGFLSYLLPLLMLLCGILLWVTPQQRIFYSAIGTLTALYSFVGLNLGGFGIGMLLGMIGGALAFAWAPVRSAAVPVDRALIEDSTDPGAPAVDDTTVDSSDHGSDNGDLPWFDAPHEPRHGAPDQWTQPVNGDDSTPRWPGRTIALIAVPALLAAGVAAGALSDPRPAEAALTVAAEPTPVVPRLPGLAEETPEPEATPVPATTEPAATPAAPPTSAATTTVPTTPAAPTTGSAPTTGAAPTTGVEPTRPPGTTAPPTVDLPTATSKGFLVASKDSVLTTKTLTVTGLSYLGLADLTTGTGAAKTTLELRSATLNTDALRLASEGSVLTADAMKIVGATLFITRIAGMFGDIEVIITPTAVLELGTAFMLTEVTMHLALVQGNQIVGPNMNLTIAA